MSDGRRQGRDNSVHSVDRAISILQVLSQRRVAGITEIAKEISVHKSTVSRLIATLEARGMVEQASMRGGYRLAYGIQRLADGVGQQHDLTVISRTVCNRLAEELKETVIVAVHEGRTVVSIDQVNGSDSLTIVNRVGQAHPLHPTAAGKVFLAYMPRTELQSYLDAELERLTPHTIVDPGVLESELETVRKHGYARVDEEQEIGLAAVAAPIRAHDGQVAAALVVSGPAFRINDDTIPGIVEHLLAAAAEISERNGYPKAG
ncbi:IclR family transcriptional regulator [Streptomyces sp. BV286]|uniref:IclR family transcriptional regulator n=1 Tax=Streptomyces sp. BV286 TaxID=2849672 RepID=UPI001C2E1A8E|nr:IclR family transcriptional regulator [Streptomyces sp. BV286]MBV1935590.1 IclR family transcriptional regulator [Streptomyces sp. BV286]